MFGAEEDELYSKIEKLEADNAALRKVLGFCREAIEDLINSNRVFANGQFADLYNLIEQALKKFERQGEKE